MPIPRLLKAHRACLLAACAVAWFAVPGRSNDDSYPVRAEFKADPPDQRRQTITVVLTIKSGWRLHANPVGVKELEESQVLLVVKNKEQYRRVDVTYPPGLVVKEPVFGDFRVYKDQVTLQAVVERRAGDAEPVQLRLSVRPVNDLMCLTPRHFPWTSP